MRDQADRLRQVIDSMKLRQAAGQQEFVGNFQKKSARVITVTSGKGGVGKTNITINLGIALRDLGYKVVILDTDFGLANIDILLGIMPRYTLLDVVLERKSIFEVLTDGPKDIKFLSGGSGVEELVKLDKRQIERFLSSIKLLDRIYDIILIDTGAGLSDNVMSFVMAADEILLVTTPEPTSVTDAYALIKMVSNRDRNKLIRVIVNRAEDAKEANDILNKLTLVARKFLNIELFPLGYLLQDESVTKAVKLQQPFSLSYPKSQASKLIREMSRKLSDYEQDRNVPKAVGLTGFINRLIRLMDN